MMMKSLINQQAQEENMSNLTSASGEASGSSGNRNEHGSMYPQQQYLATQQTSQTQTQSQPVKRKRNLPGNPDPDAEVIALSPKTILTTNRFVCEICNKGFQRDQNLQLHRRGHNLPWKLKQRTSKEVRKKVYVCPEPSCVHHDPSRALGDLTGIKKHFFRKHGEKKWKCEKCSKRYAVQSDWKAHSKTCGTKEYRCDCGTLFSRRDSFITHRAFCDALAEESARAITGTAANQLFNTQPTGSSSTSHINLQFDDHHQPFSLKKEPQAFALRPEFPPWLNYPQAMGAGLGPPPPSPSPPQPPSQIDFSSSMFPTRFDHQDYRESSLESRNPNPTSLGPTLPPYHHPTASPHISATALLQKAAQMGATMSNKTGTTTTAAQTMLKGPHQTHVSSEPSNNNTTGFSLNLSSREELATGFLNNLASSYGNKAGGIGTTGTAAGTSGGPPPPPPSNLLLHDMITFEGSTFDDAFGGFLDSNKKDHHHHQINETLSRTGEAAGNGGGSTSGANNDGMTRDFLSLRPLSHSDIFNIAGLGNCINTSSNQNQKPWQG